MSAKELLNPILDQGIRHTNFFEGRLLTGEDLRNQHEANREHDRRLGRAIGPGIVGGLEVELLHDGADGESPTVRVTKGLAINREGEIIGLPDNDITLALAEPREPVKWDQANFYTCAGPPGVQHLPSGAGVYILVMSPIAGYKERAPKSGLGDNGIAKGCGSKYIQEGVKFRLVELSKDMLINLESNSVETSALLKDDLLSEYDPVTKGDLPRLSKLRNILAHLCFGTEKLKNFVIDPFDTINGQSPYLSYGALDALRDLEVLNECDVPLSLLYWTLDGVAFLDLWSVRRQPYEISQSHKFTGLLSSRHQAEANAILFQFQTQINELLRNVNNTAGIRARDFFYYLPPVGFLPITSVANPTGLTVPNFFDGITKREPIFIEGARLGNLISHSVGFPAVLVSRPEIIWLYLIRENQQKSLDTVTSTNQPVVVFSTPYMDYLGESRFDINRFNYSNYSLLLI